MVTENMPVHFCEECPEVIGDPCEGWVFCPCLNQRVWAKSLMCPHGEDLLEVF
jgi:hypothetical protein